LEREGSSNYAVEEGEVHLQIEEGTSNHTIQRILQLPLVPIIIIIFNIFHFQ
jgi:hypothetical protein